MSKKHEVAITGIGLVTPLGNTKKENWDALVSGKSGISIQDRFESAGLLSSVAGFVKNEQPLLDAILSPKHQKQTDRFIHLALLAGQQAMDDAGLTSEQPEDRSRFGTYVGVGIGGLTSITDMAHNMRDGGPRKISPHSIPKVINNLAPAWLSMRHNLQGPNLALSNACVSSTDALGHAFRMIRDGYADLMLAGGTESCAIPIVFAGFGNMRALSSWKGDARAASRPFEKDRSGFVMAEGAAMLVLERKDHALKRGAQVYATLAGYGACSDAHHITAVHPEGRGARAAIRQALDDAQIGAEKIDYINAHGTSTHMNDRVEAAVIKSVFDGRADAASRDHLLVSSTKSMTGHMLGATGAAECAFTALALKHQIAPPTINLDQVDPACAGLDFVAHEARDAKLEWALSESFGFGGGNAVVVLKR